MRLTLKRSSSKTADNRYKSMLTRIVGYGLVISAVAMVVAVMAKGLQSRLIVCSTNACMVVYLAVWILGILAIAGHVSILIMFDRFQNSRTTTKGSRFLRSERERLQRLKRHS